MVNVELTERKKRIVVQNRLVQPEGKGNRVSSSRQTINHLISEVIYHIISIFNIQYLIETVKVV